MAASVIGALRVNLGLDSAKFERGLKKSKTSLSGFEKAVSRGIVAAGAAIGAAFAGISVAVKSTINDMDNLSKVSKQIGIPVEELSQLRFAADLAGVSFEQLSNGVGKLAKSMSDSLRSATSEQAAAFKALGVSVTDSRGNLKSTSQVMGEIATKFSGLKDDAGKTAIAMSIFGRAGRSLIPLLNEGASGIQKMKDEADALGLTISGTTAAAAEKFNDTLTRLKSVFSGMINQLTQGMLPALQSIASAMLDSAQKSTLWVDIGNVLGTIFRVITTGIIPLVAQLKILVLWFSTLIEVARKVTELDFSGAMDSLRSATSGTIQLVKQAATDVANVWTTVADEVEANAPETGTKLATPMMEAAKKVKVAKEIISKELTDLDRFWENTAGIFQSAGAGLFDDLIAGSFNLRRSLKELLGDITSLLSNNVMRQILTGSFGSGSATGGGLIGSLAKMFTGFATGGSFNVGGAGGMDSQLVAFRASPNETVSVTKPGQERGGGGSNVTIINESKAMVEEGQSGTDAEGNRFQRLYVRDAIHEALPSGLKRQQGFNLRPTVARR